MRALLVLAVLSALALGLALVQAGGDGAVAQRKPAETPAPPAAGGSGVRFTTLPPRAPLPTATRCAARVRRHPWEPRPQNQPENRTPGAPLTLPADSWQTFGAWHALARRVDGAFTGTTDEIIQWASCKWGFDEHLTRAQAHVESSWNQEHAGDHGHSVGLLQVKATTPTSPHHYTWPHSRTSTAYNLDYALAWRRACYDGHFAAGGWLPTRSRGDLWGCIGLWYSGRWHHDDRHYRAAVHTALHERPWTHYGP